MAVISITITEDDEEIVDGIPKTISLSTNIPSTIFYTLDGSVPTTSSSVYVTSIQLPLLPSPRVRLFATNGTDSSAIIEIDYGPNISSARLSHSGVTGFSNQTNNNGIFGSQSLNNGNYINPATTGITVLAPDKATYLSGLVDENGNPAALVNAPIDSYQILKSETNSIGESGYGIGTLIPVTSLPERNNEAPEESSRANKLFNPKAMVIYQDFDTEDPERPPSLNREFFSMEIPEKERDGVKLYNSQLSTASSTGSFLRAYHNARDNTITYYYRDSSTNRWIISKQPYLLRDPNVANLSNMVFGRETGTGFVFKWYTYSRRVLT